MAKNEQTMSLIFHSLNWTQFECVLCVVLFLDFSERNQITNFTQIPSKSFNFHSAIKRLFRFVEMSNDKKTVFKHSFVFYLPFEVNIFDLYLCHHQIYSWLLVCASFSFCYCCHGCYISFSPSEMEHFSICEQTPAATTMKLDKVFLVEMRAYANAEYQKIYRINEERRTNIKPSNDINSALSMHRFRIYIYICLCSFFMSLSLSVLLLWVCVCVCANNNYKNAFGLAEKREQANGMIWVKVDWCVRKTLKALTKFKVAFRFDGVKSAYIGLIQCCETR